MRGGRDNLSEFRAPAWMQTANMQGNPLGTSHARQDFTKARCPTRSNHVLALMEVLVIGFVLVILAVLLVPTMHASRRKAKRISCVNNLKEISLAVRIWEGNHGDAYPMEVSMTNGGAMELAAAGNAARIFQVMSNELSIPKVLLRPADTDHSLAKDFQAGFSRKYISYFVNLDAVEANPQMMLFGDDNFVIGGVPVNPGFLKVPANASIGWGATRHRFSGNVAITDGSVQQLTIPGLQQALQNTNRILIP
jgi:hypothetical protein